MKISLFRSRGIAVSAIALVLGILILPSFFAVSAYAETSKDLSFSIENLSPYSIQNSTLNLTIKTKAVDTTFTISVLAPTNTRSELFNFADNLGKRRVRDTLEIPLSSFIPSTTAANEYTVVLPVNADAATSLSLGASGVYPISISQSQSSNKSVKTQYSFVTNVPSVGADGIAYAQRLNVVPLLQFSPVVDRISLTNSRNELTDYGKKIRTQFLRARETLEVISGNSVPWSLVLSPEALDTYSTLRNANASNISSPSLFSPQREDVEYISDTYVPINIAELEKQNSSSVYSDLLSAGRSRVRQAELSTPARTLVTQAITPNAIEKIARTGIDNVIVDDTTFARSERPTTRPVSITKTASSLRIGVADTSIMEHLPKSLSHSAQANYLLGATSVVTLEAPSLARGLILPLDVSELNIATLEEFLNSMANNPFIVPTTTETFFSQISIDKSLSKKLEKASFPKEIAKSFTHDDLEKIEKYSRGIESMYPKNSLQSNRAVWMRLSAYSRSDRKIGKFINTASTQTLTESIRNDIALPEKRTLTITSRENEIPVTIRNTSGVPISVVVRIKSEKLAFPQGSSFPALLDEQNTTVQIPVKARTSGSFPLSIEIVTPSESVLVSKQSATVRSTAVSGAGMAIAGASALFLALWWASHIRRSRKKPIAPIINIAQEKFVS